MEQLYGGRFYYSQVDSFSFKFKYQEILLTL